MSSSPHPTGSTTFTVSDRTGTARHLPRGWVGLAIALLLVTATGLLTGAILPRGPVTTVQAVTMLAICLGLGAAVGVFTITRWMVLVAPVIFLTTFELARVPATGPTVDGVYLGSIYGIMALLVGRGVDLVVMGLPLAVGVLWGAGGGRRPAGRDRRARPGAGWYLRHLGIILVTIPVVVLAVALLRPATTAPIVGPDGEVLDRSVAELVTLSVGGHEQSMLLRGHDRDAPVPRNGFRHAQPSRPSDHLCTSTRQVIRPSKPPALFLRSFSYRQESFLPSLALPSGRGVQAAGSLLDSPWTPPPVSRMMWPSPAGCRG